MIIFYKENVVKLQPMKKIFILIDNPTSWIVPFGAKLCQTLKSTGHDCALIHSAEDVQPCKILFILGCEKILSQEVLSRSEHNVVIHESDLPYGRGWAPLTWQVLEGKTEIVFSVLKANKVADGGEIYFKESLYLKGDELCHELRQLQGEKTVELCLKFTKNVNSLKSVPQTGFPTYYPRRSPRDSELQITMTLEELFPLLRVCDNNLYPAFFFIKGQKYYLKIYKADD